MSDVSTSKRRRRKREIRPDIDRRASAPFNAEVTSRTVPDPYSTTGGKIVVTATLRDDPLGQLYAWRAAKVVPKVAEHAADMRELAMRPDMSAGDCLDVLAAAVYRLFAGIHGPNCADFHKIKQYPQF
jgi:hypothetical protein